MAGYELNVLFCLLGIFNSAVGLSIIDTITPSCTVKTDQGTLDLSTLTNIPFKVALAGGGTGGGYLYWYPCKDYSPQECTQSSPSSGEVYTIVTGGLGPGQEDCEVIASKADASFAVQQDNLVLKYESEGEEALGVKFTCTTDATTFSLPDPDNPVAVLTGKGACLSKAAGTTTSPGGGGHGLSVGSVLCIIALVLVVVYALAGVLFMKFYKKAEGAEVIPNKTFWTGFPGYVKDGVIFVVKRGKPAEKSYDNI